ncbi:MAG: valine--tRNA ligase [Candidatus Diapherotrites archaeon]|nr:valine--tRNA ligase [Candidatus Diapherotrites archaeon]
MAITETRWEKDFEQAILTEWLADKRHAFKEEKGKKVFSIDTPPPYVNTPVHIGQAATYVLMDMFARYKKMKGFNVLFPLGLDRNGLPIEMAAEKKFGISVHRTPREEFLEKCRQILEETSGESIDTFQKLGIGFNSFEKGNEIGALYLTDSEEYRAMTQSTFIDLWNAGLIYEDTRINNYCPGCGTTIADSEIEYEMKTSKFNDLKFRVKETGEEIIIGTTRPELVCTCGMVIFNPKDDRYSNLDGKHAITPLFEKEVPIKAHPIAEIGKGTGLAMMCSAGDLSDIRFFREMNLEPVIAIGADGRMNEHAGFLKGLKVKEAREKMVEELQAKGLLVEQKQVMHRTPICERSKHEIEFIAMPEYYCKQLDSKEKMKELAEKINFFSPKSRQIMLDWIDSVNMDWPVSRRRFYATEIPLWYCKKCGTAVVPPKGKYYRPWKEKPPVQKCPKCGHTEFRGEERVFDTWFDSSSSPLFILGYGRNNAFFDSHYPCTLRPQGKEIVRTWLYYTVLKSYLLFKKPVFEDVWVNYHILDEKGNKMSKSKGNVIDPQKILKQYGAEPFRLWCATEGNLANTDFKCSEERIRGAGKTLTKLWNVARFISGFELKGKNPKLQPIDEWILGELNELVEFSEKHFDEYDFFNPASAARNFLWETFASHYLELVKSRAYNSDKKFSDEEQEAAIYTLNLCLDTLLKLFAPVMPFICHRLYKELRGKDIHTEAFPTLVKGLHKPDFTAQELMALNSEIWNAKKAQGKRLNEGIESFAVPEKFKSIEGALKTTHGIAKIEWKK